MNKDVVRVFGHPLHASMVHLPIGLLALAPAWDVVALASGGSTWWAIGFWTVAAGVAVALLVALFGLAGLVRAVEEPAPRATAIRHMLVNVGAVVAYAAGLLARGGALPPAGREVLVLVLDVAGLGLLSYAGWLGGELVFRHGVGSAGTSAEAPASARSRERAA